MIPLAVKQQKSSAKMAAFSPEMKEIQTKYAKNQAKMAEEMQKLYDRENYKATAGCLPSILQFLILFGLIDVIYKPMKHIIGASTEIITKATEILKNLGHTMSTYSPESSIIASVHLKPDAYAEIGQDMVSKIMNFDLNFMGIDLGAQPTWGFNVLILIPILSGLTAFLVSYLSMKANPATIEGAMGTSMKVMMYTMPIMSVAIAFKVPAGVGMYWIMTNVMSIIQTLVLNKYYNPVEMAEKAKADLEIRKEKDRQERHEAKQIAKTTGDEDAKKKAMSQKEINRQKLALARKRDAEKYGEVYVEVTDDDLE